MGVEFIVDNAALAAERRYLMAYATFKLRDTDLANDAVQDTLVAAMQAKAQFAGRSSLRTWLVSILRNKICDLLASRRRAVFMETVEDESDDDRKPEGAFDARGRWKPSAAPTSWGSPESAMENKEFWRIFHQCLNRMPARLQEVFVLREILGEPIDAICKNVGVTPSNCSVMLHRARMRLQPCLQETWFGAAGMAHGNRERRRACRANDCADPGMAHGRNGT